MGAAFGPGATGFVGVTVAFPAFGFAGFGLAALDFAGFATAGFAVVEAGALRAEPRRSPPMRVGRVEPRLPRTLFSAGFLAFFLADFWATSSKPKANFPNSRFGGVQSLSEAGVARFDFKKYSA